MGVASRLKSFSLDPHVDGSHGSLCALRLVPAKQGLFFT